MENYQEQIVFLDHVYSTAVPQPSFEDVLNMNSTIDSNNKGPSGLQSYQDQGLAEIGNVIHIPFYFENNNVYSRINHFFDQTQGLQNNNNNNNNMLLQSNSDYKQFDRFSSQPKSILDVSGDGFHEINNMTLSHMFGSVLESPFPSPNLMETMTTLPVPVPVPNPSYSMMSFGDSQNFFRCPGSVPLYEGECHSPNSSHSISSLCSQKPPVYTKWTEEEDELLRAAISIYGPHKWSLIAAHVPNRTPMQCSTRWLGALNPTIHKGRWTPEEDNALKESVGEYADLLDSDGHPQPIPWNKIASRIPHRTGIQCQARWSEALDPSVRKGKWSPEEDEVLKEGVRRYGRCWIRIAELIEGRTQRQCRTRWVQIKNKQAKMERDAMSAKAAAIAATVSTDDESDILNTPPRTTPSTPALLQGLIPIHHVTTTKGPTSPESATESCVTTPENLSSSPPPPPFKNDMYIYSAYLQ